VQRWGGVVRFSARGRGPDAGQPAARGQLLPGRASRVAALVLAVCIVAVAALGAWLAHRTEPTGVDSRAGGWLISHAGPAPLILRTVDLGEPLWVTVICVVAGLACLVTRRYRGLLLVAIAVPLAGGITEYVLKPLFHRTIDGFLAFPSGHVTAVTAMAVSFALLLTGPSGPPLYPALRWLTRAGALLTVASVAVGVVIAHYHYFTDTIGGACVGTGTVLATALLLDRICQGQTGRSRPRKSLRSASGDTKRTASRPVSRAASTLPGESSMKTVRAASRSCRPSRISKIARSGFATPSRPEITVPSNHCRNSNRSRRTT
jgi:membrane-associated phospholipid phosphatase